MDDALGREVVQRRGDVQRERQQLLERERPVARQQLVERRPVEVLEHQVREAAVGHGAERAHDDRVREPLEQRRLAREVAQRARVARLVGAQDLGHEHGEPVLVPHEHRLVAAPAADPAQHGAPGRELVALVEAPGRPRPPRLPGRRGRDRGVGHSSSGPSEDFELSAPTGWSDGCSDEAAERRAEREHDRGDRGGEDARAGALIDERVVVGEGEEGVGERRGHRRAGRSASP